MSISSIARETSRPPISLTGRGLVDHAAARLALWLLGRAEHSRLRRADRLARQADRLVRQAEFDKLLDAIADRDAQIDSAITLRALP